jgi:hypothetical protein
MYTNNPITNGKHQKNMFKDAIEFFYVNSVFGNTTIYRFAELMKIKIDFITPKFYIANGEKNVKSFRVSAYQRTGELNEYDVFLTYTDTWGNWHCKKWAGTYQEYLDYTTENERCYNIYNEIGLPA